MNATRDNELKNTESLREKPESEETLEASSPLYRPERRYYRRWPEQSGNDSRFPSYHKCIPEILNKFMNNVYNEKTMLLRKSLYQYQDLSILLFHEFDQAKLQTTYLN